MSSPIYEGGFIGKILHFGVWDYLKVKSKYTGI